jgi:para-nitrobenzyl esterase
MILIEMKKTFNKTALLSSLFSILILVSLLLSGVTALAQGSGGLPQTIAIGGGKISGLALGENKDVLEFKGIPYAKPPVGPLRWKPPQPVEAWEGVRQCTEYGPACLQPDLPGWTLKHEKRSEDCLYLNVWTAAKSAGENRPVMMWIHGGGNIIGAAHLSTPTGNECEALARQGVVVVSINYRLGAFGYFAHPLLSKESQHNVSGNYGLLDQIAALKWIQNNIKAFGGDSGNVTIFGESAGATNVVYLMASPLAKGLFHQAISESGTTFGIFANRHLREGWYGMEPMEKQGERVTKDLGCAEAADPLAALRALSAEKLLEGSKAVMMPPGNLFTPVVDGWVLPDDVMTIFEQGKQNIVPLVAGTNADEGSIFFMKSPFDSVEAYRGFLKGTYRTFADEMFAMYPAKEPSEILKAIRDVLADYRFVAPTRGLVREMNKAGSKTYLYHFTMTGLGPLAALGAFHTAEIVYVFNDIERVKNTFKVPFEGKHQALANTMSAYWVQFAKTGNPNKEGLPEWPAYHSTKDQYIEFGEVVKVGQGLRKEKCDLWDNFVAERRKNR